MEAALKAAQQRSSSKPGPAATPGRKVVRTAQGQGGGGLAARLGAALKAITGRRPQAPQRPAPARAQATAKAKPPAKPASKPKPAPKPKAKPRAKAQPQKPANAIRTTNKPLAKPRRKR
jgi:histone H1/5